MVILQGEIEYNQQLWSYERPLAQNTMGNSTKYQDYILLGWKKKVMWQIKPVLIRAFEA